MNPPYLQKHERGVILAVRVTPRASQSKIQGVQGEELKITLNAPPADGQANRELFRLLAKVFSLPKSSVVLLRGETSRSKQVLLSGADPEKVLEKIREFVQD
ncbi:MAG: DUF167 domain-containing protein [bacterium]|jgi:uncharacterized protein (TIGR00251 family)